MNCYHFKLHASRLNGGVQVIAKESETVDGCKIFNKYDKESSSGERILNPNEERKKMKLTRRERQSQGGLAPQQSGMEPAIGYNRLRREIDRLFDDPFGFLAPSTSFFEGWTPAVDIFEDKDKYVVKAELPGMRQEDIQVALDGATLTIAGERKQEEEKKEGENWRS